MVRVSYDQKPYRRILMETYGAEVVASPSPDTNDGRAVLAETPDSPGSLGIAISEAVEDAGDPRRHEVLARLGAQPRRCCTRRSSAWRPSSRWRWPARSRTSSSAASAAARTSPASRSRSCGRKLAGRGGLPDLAVEPKAAPSLTRGEYRYDFGDTAGMTPIVKMYTLGHDFVPEPHPRRRPALPRHVAAGQPAQGAGRDRGASVHQSACFEAGVQFARAEGILPAPESSHAIRVAIDEALEAKEAGEAAGHPVQPVRPRPLRPGRRTSATCRARSRTTSTRPRRSRRRSARPAEGRLTGRRRRPTARIRHVPKLACRAVGARSTPSRRSTRCSPRSDAARAAGPTSTRSAVQPSGATTTGAEPARPSRAAAETGERRLPGTGGRAAPTGGTRGWTGG